MMVAVVGSSSNGGNRSRSSSSSDRGNVTVVILALVVALVVALIVELMWLPSKVKINFVLMIYVTIHTAIYMHCYYFYKCNYQY